MLINSNFTGLSGNRKGFTLLELLIAVFILVTVLSTIYAAYRGTFRIIKDSEDDGEIYSMARTAMDRMFKDLSAFSAAGGAIKLVSRSQEAMQGEFTGLTFVSGAHLAFSEDERPSGLAEITYYIDEDQRRDGNYRLLRNDVFLAEAGKEEQPGGGFVLCEQRHSLIFKFFDNAGREQESWDSDSDAEMQKNRAPAMVSIELKLENHKDKDHPYTFTTKVFLPLSTVVSSLQ
jgi:prepilin-type N-terminal cleavage/methylation domain-containing protein